MSDKIVNNEVLVVINEACRLMECIFRDGAENVFDDFTRYYGNLPGYSIDYGVDTVRGGYDKSTVVVRYNRAKHYSAAASNLELLLKTELGFKWILWQRDIDYGTKKSNVLAEVC